MIKPHSLELRPDWAKDKSTGWRWRTEKAYEKRRLHATRWGYFPWKSDWEIVWVPRPFKRDMVLMRDGKLKHAEQAGILGEASHSLRAATSKAWEQGLIHSAVRNQADNINKSANSAKHMCAPSQIAWASPGVRFSNENEGTLFPAVLGDSCGFPASASSTGSGLPLKRLQLKGACWADAVEFEDERPRNEPIARQQSDESQGDMAQALVSCQPCITRCLAYLPIQLC